MKLYDPIKRRNVVREDCAVYDSVLAWTPVCPGDGNLMYGWFAVFDWTGESVAPDDLPEPVRIECERVIRRRNLVDRLTERCRVVRGLGQAPPMREEEARQLLERVIWLTDHLRVDLRIAIDVARARGFTTTEVAFALDTLEDAVALREALQNVEVVNASQLVEMMRAHTG